MDLDNTLYIYPCVEITTLAHQILSLRIRTLCIFFPGAWQPSSNLPLTQMGEAVANYETLPVWACEMTVSGLISVGTYGRCPVRRCQEATNDAHRSLRRPLPDQSIL